MFADEYGLYFVVLILLWVEQRPVVGFWCVQSCYFLM